MIPKADLNDPRAMIQWLDLAAAEDPNGAARPAYGEAYGALTAWAGANDLSQRVAALYHNPKVQLAAQDGGIQWYWEHPNAAYEKLLQMTQKDPSASGENLRHEAPLAVAEAK